ncbi:hypothetical protein [Flavobacterium pallidum]|uniref:Outer membrane protein beta-barrel domain-containing protein n=1 Tax=Flavobacterium pallidum TaxID=2172098 RepID=A0A2S1SE18_9FLAO|nr:hypothetical protein [Flavobacterium pallidum]AWI24631.1 hypothetical protein HYN49_01285 [Flavobacterium pallidum]
MNKLLFLVLIACKMQAQDTIVVPKVDVYKRNIVEVSYGTPLGALADKYQSSINTGFYMRTKVARRQFIDFGAELGAVIKGRAVEYNVNNQKILLEGSKTTFLLGLRYTRFWYQSPNGNFHIETNSGIGWKYLHYSKPEGEPYDSMDFSPALHTIALSQGIKLMFHGFGVHCSYHYSPYGLFNGSAERDFGASSVNVGVSGSWNF